MPRLPLIGSDDNTWGTILNDYLSVSHNSDGSLKAGLIAESQLDSAVQTKLNGAGGVTNLSVSSSTTDITIVSSTGTDATVSSATGSVAGVLTASDKTKLDGIAAGAQVNTVSSVAGKTGVVTLTKTDVGLGSVDDTSDSDKNSAAATLTNKTISGGSNTLSNIPQSAVTNLTADLAAKADTSSLGNQVYVYNSYADAPALPVNSVVVSITGS